MQDISMQNFETDLMTASVTQPILLDIWAPWCGPCKSLGPMLEKLEVAYKGRFKLAKLNSDDEPQIAAQLSQMFGVRSIPFCVMFKGGEPVDGFVGALPEAQIRSFLDKHVADQPERPLDGDIIENEPVDDPAEAGSPMDKLERAFEVDPANDTARYQYLRALLAEGDVAAAREVYEPVASRIVQDARLTACGHWLAAAEHAASGRSKGELEELLAGDKRNFEARFELAQQQFAAQQFTEAMDTLLEILMRDKTWNDGLARKTYVAILEVITQPAAAAGTAGAQAPVKGTLELAGRIATTPADPVVDSYRRRLSMVVF